jgi:SAM-dependent methyltransferase
MPTRIAEVKRANRRLYDKVARRYEAIDGRRNEELLTWIRSRLGRLAKAHGNTLLLDLGSGRGVVTRAARGIFEQTIALDLSPGILAAAGPIADHRLAGDTDALPIAEASVNVVSCFAVLHHLCDTRALAGEVARVLRPCGAFWSDHDMDLAFYRRFRWALAGYRRLRGAGREYEQAGVTADTYAMAECQGNGIDGGRVLDQLAAAGLDASASFHWFGLTPLANRLFGTGERSRGWAPLLRIVAIKPAGREPGRRRQT